MWGVDPKRPVYRGKGRTRRSSSSPVLACEIRGLRHEVRRIPKLKVAGTLGWLLYSSLHPPVMKGTVGTHRARGSRRGGDSNENKALRVSRVAGTGAGGNRSREEGNACSLRGCDYPVAVLEDRGIL